VKYLSVCSGIEAATVAWHHLGWEPAGFAEIEKFPAQVLAHHYPGVPNFGDLTKHDQWPLESGAVDLLVGGTPCQAFSVAGLRRGMDDARGQLTLEFVRLAARLRPRWVVWENVPGVLSSGGGRDFGSFLGALAQLGYGWAYRVLDAQYFGVAQRRRRVFVVGYFGDWRRAAAVLFERESVRGNPPPRRQAWEGSAVESGKRAPISSGSGADVVGAIDCRINAQRAQNAGAGHLIPAWPATKACTLYARYGDKQGLEDQRALGGASLFVPAVGSDCYNGSVTGDVAAKIGTAGSSSSSSGPTVMVQQPAMAFHENQKGKVTLSDTAGSLTGGGGKPGQGYQAVMQPIGTDCFNARQDPVQYGDQAGALDQDGYTMAVAQPMAFSAKDHGADASSDIAPTLRTMGHAGSHANGGGQMAVAYDVHGTLAKKGASQTDCHTALRSRPPGQSEASTTTVVAFKESQSGCRVGHVHATLDANKGSRRMEGVLSPMAVRRLTPRECERLQGFPDGYTDIRPRGKDTPDGPRYKALGNSMAVPVMRWIGERIAKVDQA
jgi:DNA (cytosine-5)-methyltransferase 1